MQYTQAMLPILHAVEGNNWHYLISGDESWFFLESITISHVDSVERWPDHKAETKHSERKFMFTIMWNASGFYIVDRLLNDTKMNSNYFVTNILILCQ
jgi:hypothetical protein